MRYVITNQSRKGKIKAKTKIAIAEAIEAGEYDSNAYLNHLLRAAESLLLPFGLSVERLRRIVSIQEQA